MLYFRYFSLCCTNTLEQTRYINTKFQNLSPIKRYRIVFQLSFLKSHFSVQSKKSHYFQFRNHLSYLNNPSHYRADYHDLNFVLVSCRAPRKIEDI